MSQSSPGCFLPAGGLMMNLTATASRDAGRAGGGDTLMQHHGPNGMGGPLRGTSVWWHGRADSTEPLPVEEPETERRSNRGRKEEEPMIRQELVERVRREIAAGVYDTPAKWDAALDRLLERIHRD